jgi:ABC-type branched-subunit amino acid transport system ATPase component/branched-subunit amino acid ABC-type transport system permease component
MLDVGSYFFLRSVRPSELAARHEENRMSDVIKFFFLGLGAGGIYALVALGVVVTYRGSGVVNFATGAVALVGAATYFELRGAMPVAPAIVLGVLASSLTSVLIQVAIMRPMRNASPLARVIATLGLLAAAEQGAQQIFGASPQYVPAILPTTVVHLYGTVFVPVDRFILLGITIVLYALFQLLYKRTRFGLATTGVAENELAMSTLGWSPDAVATVNWALGGAVAGVGGILLLPLLGLSPTAMTLLIIPALAAALVGGFLSLPLTLAGGLVIGILESEATRFIHAPGWSDAASFLVIIVILVVRGRGLPLRSHLTERLPKIGSARLPWKFVVPVGVVLVITVLTGTGNWAAAVTASAVYALLCLSLVVITGYAGQLSLAQFTLAGVGALIAARLNDAAHVPYLLAVVIGVAGTVPVALVVAVPSLRVRGVNLAVATMGLAVVINSVVFSNPSYTGGITTGTVVPPPTIFGFDIDAGGHPARYALYCLILMVIVAFMVANLRRGRPGRSLIAVRDNERAAASLGISVFRAKLFAFSLGGAVAALAGILLAFETPYVTFGQYDVFGSIEVALLAVIGGIGFISGAFVGALGGSGGIIPYWLSYVVNPTGWFLLATAVLLVVTIIFSPDGIASANIDAAKAIAARFRKTVSQRRAATVAKQIEAALTPAGAVSDAPAGQQRARVTPSTLELRDLSLRFGGVTALRGVNLTVHPGEVVGLIGPNGAGKTTLIDVATGFYRHNTGDVLLDGRSLKRASAAQRARLGLARSFQSLELFEDLNVITNLRAASDDRGLLAWLADLFRPHRGPLSPGAIAVVDEFELGEYLTSLPGELPYAQRRIVAIARAVSMMPSVLLLDEPAAGLDERSTRELGTLIQTLAHDWGMAVLLIEHDVPLVLSSCDRVVALNFGAVVAEGTPEEIRTNNTVIEAYLGSAEPDTATESIAAADTAGRSGA